MNPNKQMRRGKNKLDHDADSHPKLTMNGIARLLGVSRRTVYRRIERESFSLVGIRVLVTTGGNLYDMEDLFRRVFPSANGNTRAALMFDFMEKNRGLAK